MDLGMQFGVERNYIWPSYPAQRDASGSVKSLGADFQPIDVGRYQKKSAGRFGSIGGTDQRRHVGAPSELSSAVHEFA